MDSVGRFITIVAAVILVLIVPLSEIAKGKAEAMQGRADRLTEEFADTARHQGHITTDMYEEYLTELGKLGDTYHISLQVAHPVTGKESAERNSGVEIPDLTAEYASFKGSAKLETKQLQATTHTHTDDCYSGHRHNTKDKFIHYHQHTSDCVATKTQDEIWIKCTRCTGEYQGYLEYGIPYLSRGNRYPYTSFPNYSYQMTTYQLYERSYQYLYWPNTTICPYCGNHDLRYYDDGYSSWEAPHVSHKNPSYSYSCGYNKDMNGDGSTDNTVGTTVAYAYEKDYPQSTSSTDNCIAIGNTNTTLEMETVHAFDFGISDTSWGRVTCTACGKLVASFHARHHNNLSTSEFTYVRFDSNGNIVADTYYTGTVNNVPKSKYDSDTNTIALITNRDPIGSQSFWSVKETYLRAYTNGGGTRYANGGYYTYTKPFYPIYTSNGNYIEVPNIGCPYCAGTPRYSCGQIQDDTLDCGNVVISLSATNPSQTVYKGDPIITTATATMLDGTTRTVSCTASGYDSNSIGTQVVTLTYYGLVNNTKTYGSKTCTTTVTVKSRKTLTGIAVTPTSQEIKRYTDPTFTVTAAYSDGTSNQVMGYTITGLDNTKIGSQIVLISYTEEGVNKSFTASVTVKRLNTICQVCGTVYELDDSDIDQGCPTCSGTIASIRVSPEEVTVSKGEELPVVVTATYKDGRTGILSGWTSDYNPIQLGLQNVKITYETFSAIVMVTVSDNKTCPICGNIYAMNPDGTDPGCPICAEEVISIAASPKNITIEKNGSLPITVTATYKDGHTEVVDGWGTDFMADKTGEYEVPIYYKSAVDYVYVTVLDEGRITCPYCLTQYSYTDYPNGCPICSKQIVGIEAQLRYGGNQVLYRSDLSLQVVLIYRDTHRKITYTGFEYSGFDSSILGIQTVTVTYGEFSTTLTVEVIDNPFLVTCPVCGSQYYLNEDGSDPGCPYCNKDPGEHAVFYFECTYTMNILDTLYNNGIYYLKKGDYFTVTITTTRDSIISRLANLFRSRKREDLKKDSSSFGGEVSII